MAGDEFIRQERMAELMNRDRRERRAWWTGVLSGLAVVVVVLGIVGLIVFGAMDSGQRSSEMVKVCTEAGGSWARLNGEYTCIRLGVVDEP